MQIGKDKEKSTSSEPQTPKQPPKKWYGVALYQKERDTVEAFVSKDEGLLNLNYLDPKAMEGAIKDVVSHLAMDDARWSYLLKAPISYNNVKLRSLTNCIEKAVGIPSEGNTTPLEQGPNSPISVKNISTKDNTDRSQELPDITQKIPNLDLDAVNHISETPEKKNVTFNLNGLNE